MAGEVSLMVGKDLIVALGFAKEYCNIGWQ
jgi:hypothetical protein